MHVKAGDQNYGIIVYLLDVTSVQMLGKTKESRTTDFLCILISCVHVNAHTEQLTTEEDVLLKTND